MFHLPVTCPQDILIGVILYFKKINDYKAFNAITTTDE